MEFGQTYHFRQLNYKLRPPQFYGKIGGAEKAVWYLGAPVWNHRGLINALKTPENSHQSPLEIYSANFNSIELNSSFYALPSRETIQMWCSQTPKNFRFFPKAPKDLTFRPLSRLSPDILNKYFLSLENFGEKIEESFLQFSPYVTPEHKRFLFRLLEALPQDRHFTIELRHKDWFASDQLLDRLCSYLSIKNIGLVITDTPGRRDVLHMKFPVPRLMVRFKGHNGDSTDALRLNQWLHFFAEHPHFERVSFFHHHSDESHCVESLSKMMKSLKGRTQNSLPSVFKSCDFQGSLFEADSL